MTMQPPSVAGSNNDRAWIGNLFAPADHDDTFIQLTIAEAFAARSYDDTITQVTIAKAYQ